MKFASWFKQVTVIVDLLLSCKFEDKVCSKFLFFLLDE